MTNSSKAKAKKIISNFYTLKRQTNVDLSSRVRFIPEIFISKPRQNLLVFFFEEMVLGLLFSLQNNILNITNDSKNDTGFLINNLENYNKNIAQSIESLQIVSDFANYVANKNFALYVTTSVEPSFLITSNYIKNATTAAIQSQVTKNQFIPNFELMLGAVTYIVIIAMTVIGNTLVVIAVFNYRPLKKVQNYFLVSLAASDLAVALIVMPLHVVKFLADGRWLLGVTLCQIFTTADILLCTSSIWNLCAIAFDRYFAIHNPIDYAQKRTPKFVCSIIALVWLVSVVISVPPIIGWNDWSSQKLMDHCELTTEKAFVVYSASGSFFVPLALMIVVYLKIFISARQRIRKNRGRSALLRIKKQQRSSSEFVVPTCTLTPMVCATTTSVAHILHRPKAKNKQNQVPNIDLLINKPKLKKNQRSMSQCPSADYSKRIFQIRRVVRSNSTVCDTDIPPIKRLLAVAKAQQEKTINKRNDALFIKKDFKNQLSLNITEKKINNNLPFSTKNVLNKTTIQNGGESMLSDELTTTTTTSTTKSDQNCRSSTPIPKTEITLKQKKNQTRFDDINMPKKNSSSVGIVEEQLTTTVLKNREKISVAKEKRAAKTIAVIIFVFTFCWLPFFCVYVILPFCKSCYLHPKVMQAVVWLGYINSSLNPFLYGILNLEFRRAFRKILCPKRFLDNRQKQSMAKK